MENAENGKNMKMLKLKMMKNAITKHQKSAKIGGV